MTRSSFPPRGACDCHVHVVGPKAQFPLIAQRIYTPMDAPLDKVQSMMGRLGLDRIVLVQPSFYGTDNSCMLAAMSALSATSRGVAVLPDEVPAATLDDLHGRGVRGLRINVKTSGITSIAAIEERLKAAAKLATRNHWHVQIFTGAETLVPLAPILLRCPVPIVIDHFGLIAPGTMDGPELACMADLMASGRVWVKLSAPYRIGEDAFDPRAGALARRIASFNQKRVVWGSDWPHTPVHNRHMPDQKEAPYRDLDTRKLLGLIQDWFPEPELQNFVLVRNPAELYGFM